MVAPAILLAESAMTKRVHEAFTVRRERELMLWIARRLPAAVTPDHMTAFGLLGSLICFLGLVASWTRPAFLWVGVLGLIVQNFGDSLDGNLARLRSAERPRYGFLVDHTSDLLSQVLLALGFGLSPFVRLDCALLALVGYLSVSVVSFLRLQVTGVLHISYNRVGPTEIRIVLLLGMVALYFFGPMRLGAFDGRLGVPDLIALAIFVAASFMAYSAAWSTAQSLLAQEGSAVTSPSARSGSAPPA
jgi:archaetidylinositol phosphate synthase